MKKAAILLDSSSLYDGKSEKNIFMIPLTIILNYNGFKEYKETTEISSEKIYDLVKQGKKLSTSQPSIGEGILIIEKLLKEYETIYVIPLSKEISGTYDTFKSISKELDEKRVIILDCGFVGISLLDIIAKNILKMVEKEESKEAIINYVEKIWREKFGATFILNDIGHLKRGGRIGTVASFLAGILKFKIILKIDGKIDLVDKKTSLKEAVDVCLKTIDDKIQFSKNGINKIQIWSNNIDNSEKANELKKYVIEWLKNKKIEFDSSSFDSLPNLASVLTIHTGSDTIGIFVLAN